MTATMFKDIKVSSKTTIGTLGSTNAKILPKKADCTPEAWTALGKLDSAYKSLIRAALYPVDAHRHEANALTAMMGFMETAGLEGSVLALFGCANLHNSHNGELVFTSGTTFKKNILRATMYAQANGGVLCQNPDKADKVSKAATKRKTVSFNINDMAAACGCAKEELIGMTFEQVCAKVAAHQAAQAQQTAAC